MTYVLRPFTPGDLTELSLLAQRLNAQRETGSSFCCARAEDIRQDFEETMEYGLALWGDGGPQGLISCFPDVEKGNADCALLLDAHGTAYLEAADQLLSAAREKLGGEMACTFFFPQENAECRNFLTQLGAARQVNEYILLLCRGEWRLPSALAARPRPVRGGERAAFEALHDAVFPGIYVSGGDIWADLGRSRFLYVISDETGLAAYGVLRIHGGAKAVAEIIGVRADARRRGYGRSLLHHLAEQAFTQFGAEELELVVDGDNQNALRLYLDTGFRIQQENNCYVLRPVLEAEKQEAHVN